MIPFSPDAKGWVVRRTANHDRPSASWWYGPNSGWGTTSGQLDYNVAVFPTKKEATVAVRAAMGRPSGTLVERVADAVAFAIAECDRRKAEVLASDRPDRAEIALANDQTKRYLQGKRRSR